MKDKAKLIISLIIAVIFGMILGYLLCLGILPKNGALSDAGSQPTNMVVYESSSDSAPKQEPEESAETINEPTEPEPVLQEEVDGSEPEPESKPVKPVVNGMFSWHKFKEKYLPVLEKYDIDQVYQCYDNQIREGDYDAIKQSLELLSDYDVWLLTGDSSWDANDMLEKVSVAKEIGGFAGVVFDVEPDDYDETYLENVKTVCAESDIPIMFCVSYRADVNIIKEVISVVDGLLVMNYDVGDEYANIKDWIPASEQYDIPLITVYELQPSDHDIGLHSSNTYDGDIDAAISNFKEQFDGEDNIGIAYHYIKYVKTE